MSVPIDVDDYPLRCSIARDLQGRKTVEQVSRKMPAAIGYFLGLLIWVGAYVLGNIAGRIVASLQGWENFSYDRPGAVFYSVIQAGLGAYFAVLGSKQWLGEGKYVKAWMAGFVWLASGAVVVLGGLSLYSGNYSIISWSTASLIVSLMAVEVVRRMDDHEFS